MSESHPLQNLAHSLVTMPVEDERLAEAQGKFYRHLGRQVDQLPALICYLINGWRSDHAKIKSLEAALKEATTELKKVLNGGLISALYIGDRGLVEDHQDGERIRYQKAMVACRGALMEVALAKDINAQELKPGRSLLLLNSQCTYAARIVDRPETAAFGRVARLVRKLEKERACVHFDDGQGEALVAINPEIDPDQLRPEETLLRVIEVASNLFLAVEVIPEVDADDRFADDLDHLPSIRREDVVGQDEAWQEIDKLLLRPLRNPGGLRLYNLDGQEGALGRHRGVFIAGPSGVGKSMLVLGALRELREVSQHKLFIKWITGSYFTSKWFGESERRARHLYHRMSTLAQRKNGLAVIVIDEAGPAFVRRTSAAAEDGGAQAHNDLTDTFLHILGTTDVLTIAIDNNPGQIDPAILRPGRLPLVRAERPRYRHCVEIAQRHLQKTRLAAGETARGLALRLGDFIYFAEEFQNLLKVRFVGGMQLAYSGRDLTTGAEIVEGIIRPAAERALDRDETAGAQQEHEFSGVGWEDLEEACRKRFSKLVSAIDRSNAGDYLKLPEGQIVQSVEKKSLNV